MRKNLLVFIIVAVSMTLYDAAASVSSLLLRLDYSWFGLGSALLYFLAGFIACRRGGFLVGVLAGMVAGLSESIIGWTISIWIGPHSSVSIAASDLAVALIAAIVVIGTTVGTVIGVIGSAAARLFERLFPQQFL